MNRMANLSCVGMLALAYCQTVSAQDAPQQDSPTPKFVDLPNEQSAARKAIFAHADRLRVTFSYWEQDFKNARRFTVGVIAGKQRGGTPDALINKEEAAALLKHLDKDKFFDRADLSSCSLPPNRPRVAITIGFWDDNSGFTEARIPSKDAAKYLVKVSKHLPAKARAGIEQFVTVMK